MALQIPGIQSNRHILGAREREEIRLREEAGQRDQQRIDFARDERGMLEERARQEAEWKKQEFLADVFDEAVNTGSKFSDEKSALKAIEGVLGTKLPPEMQDAVEEDDIQQIMDQIQLAKEEERVYKEGDVVVQPGQTIDQGTKIPKTFAPKSPSAPVKIKGPDGKPKWVAPEEAYGKEAYEKPTNAGVTARNRARKINDLQEHWGVSEAEAQGIVDGAIKITFSPTTGRAVKTNIATNEAVELDLSREDVVEEASQELNTNISLWDAAELGTGFVSALAGEVGNRIPIWNSLSPHLRTEAARRNFDTSTQGLIRGLSVNPRYPATEQERIKREISITPSMWTSTPVMRQRMIQVHEYLTSERDSNLSIANDPLFEAKARGESRVSADHIQRYLDKMEPSFPEGAPPGSRFLWKMDKEGNALWTDPEGRVFKVVE